MSLSLKPADLARARDAIDGASITPLNLSIGGSSAPGLNVIDGCAMKEAMRQITTLMSAMARSIEVLDVKYGNHVNALTENINEARKVTVFVVVRGAHEMANARAVADGWQATRARGGGGSCAVLRTRLLGC